MKKIRIGVLVLLCCLFLTGCGCSRREYTVTFNSNGGTSVESQTVSEGKQVDEPTVPTREGYTFEGWYLGLESDQKYDFKAEVTSNITLEAKWSKNVVDTEQEEDNNKETEDDDDKKTEDDDDKKTEKVCNLTCGNGYELVNGDSKDCSCKKISVSGVTLNKSNVTLVVGDSITVTATVKPSNAYDKKITWKSNNESVAKVSNGKITAVGGGTTTITATVGGKTSTVKVTVTTQEQLNLTAALNTIKAKNVSKGNTNINFSYSGCTITNTENVASGAKTVVSGGVVKNLHITLNNGTIKSTYKVECGNLTDSKTVTHTVPASSYSYTATYMGMQYVIRVGNLTNYTLISPYRASYLASAGGAQVGIHTPGVEYQMILNSDESTIYAVKSAD